jgi:hypothetical protein
MDTLYDRLKITYAATPNEINEAYARERARIISENEEEEGAASKQLKELEEAYTTLVDPGQRAAYDRILGIGTRGSFLSTVANPQTILAPQAMSTAVLQAACPHCGTLNPVQAANCTQCGKQISRPCPSCGQRVLLTQPVCPRCNTHIDDYNRMRGMQAFATEQRIQQERDEADSQVNTLEKANWIRSAYGVAFILVFLLVCVGLVALMVSASSR